MNPKGILTARSVSGWITAITILTLVLFGVSAYVYKLELEKAALRGSIRLELFVTYLKGVLEKYESLPELLARDKQLVNFLRHPGGRDRIEAFNKYLETINDISNAADTYIMDKEGLTIASSNWQDERPFVGRNFSYRPYFHQAMKGKLGRYFALGTTSVKRGYYFAYPVRHEDEIIGAVVLKTNIDSVERQWGYHDETFLVTDPDNVIFLTTNTDWRFMTFGEIDERTRELVKKSRRYPNLDLEPLDIEPVKEYPFGSIINITFHDNSSKTFLQQNHIMQEAGWTVQILSNIRPIRKKIVAVNLLVGTSLLFGYLLLVLFAQRRQRLIELKKFEDQARRVLLEANEKLEYRVGERTLELTKANKKLLKEIQERKLTEEMLKKTRSELVQAAKMATLGQLSAGINHELNQPLAAIRSYADNCRQFFLKGRYEDAAWNMEQIGELTDRMAQIGVQLKAFSRKTSGEIEIIPVHGAIDGALEILSPTIKKSKVKIDIDILPEDLEFFANHVFIQQVIVNLLSNAIHAVEAAETPSIRIVARVNDTMAQLEILDNGPGISKENLDKIFEPFFTTKKSGHGLGLGLTITERIIKEMSGKIIVETERNGGARFIILLPTPL